MVEKIPLVVIVGPTASGKTSLAIRLAKTFGGEIICADSRTIYKGLDIGTAKPTKTEQAEVPHWALDIVEPDQYFSAADFKTYANEKIEEIRSRNHIPFLVGGTGLYVDAVIFDYIFCSKADNKVRINLQQLSLEKLHEYCKKNGITLPENYKNKRYVIRTIEKNGMSPKRRLEPIENAIVVGISTDKAILRDRIEKRLNEMFTDDVISETRSLGEKYGWNSEAMKSNIYRIIRQYLDGELSLEQAKQKAIIMDWHLAKRQLTWLKRNKTIKWLSLVEAEKFLSSYLAMFR